MNVPGSLVRRDVAGALLEIRLQGPVSSASDADAADPSVPAGAGEFKLTETMVYAKA
jgi:hypothetical protein